MIYSMTGYGKKTFEYNDKTFSIEIRTLNSKQSDVYTKVPSQYKEKELELRNIASNELLRGKIEITLVVEVSENSNVPLINKEAVKAYYKQIGDISSELDIKNNDQHFLWATILRLPESLKTELETIDEKEWAEIKKTAVEVMQEVKQFRKSEGSSMQEDIIARIQGISNYLGEIGKYEKSRIENIKSRIRNNLHEFISQETIDENRFEQELIFYLEKFDITEEKVRLKNHCNYFLETVRTKEPIGKKLGFIAQEIGREINTIGSKANDSDIQKIVVQMKDELEKVKEQLMNVL